MSDLRVAMPEDVYGRGFWAALDWPRCEGKLYRPPRRPAGATVRRDGAKVGRNDPCPCGSGRKSKRCCA